jgi:hypothetical protein
MTAAGQAPRPLSRLLIGTAAALLVLALSPWIDRPLTALFYRPGAGFFLDPSWPAQLVYHGTRWITGALIAAMLGTLIWAAATRRARIRNLALYARPRPDRQQPAEGALGPAAAGADRRVRRRQRLRPGPAAHRQLPP